MLLLMVWDLGCRLSQPLSLFKYLTLAIIAQIFIVNPIIWLEISIHLSSTEKKALLKAG